MSMHIKTQKRLLTTYGNKLEQAVCKLRQEQLEVIAAEMATPREINEGICRLEESISAIESLFFKAEKTLNEYASSIDRMQSPSEKEQEEFDEYSCKAESILSTAFDYVTLLKARRSALTCANADPNRSLPSPAQVQAQEQQLQSKSLELPTLPIPIFSGNLWEWDNFWELYNNNIHSQDLPELFKFNYLLSALKGEARESINKFQVTKENYPRVIQFLVSKYDNREVLINQLIDRLDACKMRTTSAKDQRALLEQVQALTTQLAQKGEHIDSPWLIKKVLSKFPDSVKRKVISKRQNLPTETSFSMQILFRFLDEILSSEEMFLFFTDKSTVEQKHSRTSPFHTKHGQGRVISCMYCGDPHSSFSCTKYKKPQERSLYLRQNHLCLICASSKHKTTECKGRQCFNCQGLHHTSCCFRPKQKTDSSLFQKRDSSMRGPLATSTLQKQQESRPKVSAKKPSPTLYSHTVINTGSSVGDVPSQETQCVLNAQTMDCPYLPAGKVTILNPNTNELMQVDVLIDTGAEISFIDDALAECLHLPVIEEKLIRLHTFGSKEIQSRKCRFVKMNIWDNEGKQHVLKLLTHDVLTQAFKPPKVSNTDINFLRSLNLSILTHPENALIKPSILLGCDQLWNFMRTDTPPIRLPSGLHLMPTHLGYIISGKQSEEDHEVQQGLQCHPSEISQWDNLWSMTDEDYPQTTTVSSIMVNITQEEKDQWDKYWSMDAAGTEEFVGSEREVRATMDQKIWQRFNNTIERREDGYYVRLPWKEHHPPLPDNKALAFKRLVNVWSSLRKDEHLLDKYNEVFQDQLSKNIIEEVDKEEARQGETIHFIPHQAVLTPQKTTTKLRIVFDASAHYRGCPSLNDVLHRGPVILPSLHGVLLRVRTGRFAVASDVEKAFLQVRLNEADRDATRCLWLRNHKLPPTADNVRTLRFTRVTFGLKCSPFLLAGTTYFHLDQYTDEKELVEEIKRNLYVDNLLLTANTHQETSHFYQRTKSMFQDLNMNLREFTSNDQDLMQFIPVDDRSVSLNPRLLGITWNPSTDRFLLSCKITKTSPVTKRTVTSAIASVYDPMGWFLPLLFRARVYLQNLWREQCDWDSKLNENQCKEWHEIRDQCDGFEKSLPRFISPKGDQAILATFADASTNAMCACAYLVSCQVSHLLMAKAKLPSIHQKSTIPKLELNALTLAARLTNSIFEQLRNILEIQRIYVFSDSEIALSWIRSKPQKETGIFVFNRSFEIYRIAEHLSGLKCVMKFGHITSEHNPADCGTRGLNKSDLQEHVWWQGPSFLILREEDWPMNDRLFTIDDQEISDLIVSTFELLL